MTSPFRFSRSHQSDLRKCPRLALLRMWLDGTGYTRAGISIELGTGSLFHDTMGEILEHILNAANAGLSVQQIPSAFVIRKAILNQRIKYETSMAVAVDEVIRLGMSDAVERAGWHKVIRQQATLAESMVRAWLIVRLPYYLATYEIVSVEGEEQSEISPGLIFMQRKDAIVRHKENGTYHALEFKTSGNNTENFVNSWHYDLQQITHLLNFRGKYDADPKSVLLEIAYKGRKYKGDHVGALVSGYKKELMVTDGWTGNREAEVEYDWVYGRCKTKGWQKFDICDEDFGEPDRTPSEVWTSEVLDFSTLRDHCLYTEIEHHPERIEKWLNQTRREMLNTHDGLVQLEGCDTDEEFEAMADVLFPALEEKDSCVPYFGSKKCTFASVCHGQDEMLMLKQTQGFKAREPHHPGEFDKEEKNVGTN